MKIGFDAKRLFNNFTGLGNYSRFVVESLHHRYPEDEYVLFTPTVRQHPETDFFLQKGLFDVVVPPPWIQQLKLGSVWRSRMGTATRSHPIDIYHGLSHELPTRLPRGTKKVVTVHDLIFYRHPEYYNAIDVAIYKSKIKYACRIADKIIAISRQTKEDIVHYLGESPSKIEVVYQGCQTIFKQSYSTDKIQQVRQRYNLPQEFILQVGTLETRKNALLLLRAVRLLQFDIPVVLVGKKTAYVKELNEFIRREKLESRVQFIHEISFSDLPILYQLAHVFVYPSLFEGFGIPLIEAISCGVPVIASTGSCLGEAAGPGAWYVDPHKPEELCRALEEVLGSPEQTLKRIAEMKQYIGRFEPEVIADDLHKIYLSLHL